MFDVALVGQLSAFLASLDSRSLPPPSQDSAIAEGWERIIGRASHAGTATHASLQLYINLASWTCTMYDPPTHIMTYPRSEISESRTSILKGRQSTRIADRSVSEPHPLLVSVAPWNSFPIFYSSHCKICQEEFYNHQLLKNT